MSADYKGVLELIRQNQWEDAHIKVQKMSGALASEIHGYLHRIEGDFGNAGYWYSRAGMELPSNTLDEEFVRLAHKAETN